MANLASVVRPIHVGYLNDQIAALTLQLEEIHVREERKKAKYTERNIPNLEIAYAEFLAEIEGHLGYLKDVRLARSIANAVNSDARAIAELSQAEAQDEQNRRAARQMSDLDSDIEPPPPYTEEAREVSIENDVIRRLATLLSSNGDLDDDDETAVAGPSQPYERHQASALGTLAREAFQCTACTDQFRLADITQLQCEHEYCNACLKQFIMRGVIERDLTLIPPRCCGVPLLDSLIENVLQDQEMEDFRIAVIERNTIDKTYCSNTECSKFIPPAHIVAGTATCPHCERNTCAWCKNTSHSGDCSADPALQSTLALGIENRWQRCFSCHALVEIDHGCNHMTCRCGAEFCYQCGVEWTKPRRCSCEMWIEQNLYRRAEQVVDRVAPIDIRPAERQQRIVQMQEQLRDTDECDHRGRRKFEKIIGGRGRRFQCEMCYERHRQFILRCRQCQLDLCMNCRLHRV